MQPLRPSCSSHSDGQPHPSERFGHSFSQDDPDTGASAGASTREHPRTDVRVVYPQGEEERVLRAADVVAREHLAWPVVVGRGHAIRTTIGRLGLRLLPGVNCDIVDLLDPATCRRLADEYLSFNPYMPVKYARAVVTGCPEVAGPLLVASGRAHALVCQAAGPYADRIDAIARIVGPATGQRAMAVMQSVIYQGRDLFLADTELNSHPTAEEIADIALMAAAQVRRIGMEPRVALLSQSSFTCSDAPSARKMRRALEIARQQDPSLLITNELRADSERSAYADQPGAMNILIMPNLDAANIAFNLLRSAQSNDAAVGGFLLGAAHPVYLMAAASTFPHIVSMTAWASHEATAGAGPFRASKNITSPPATPSFRSLKSTHETS